MADNILAPGFKTDPYWWEAAPRPAPDDTALPAEADVAIIGSGFTGLQAALAVQRGGRQALVIEAEVPGYGASTRNAGNIVPYLWAKYPLIERRYGTEKATAMENAAVAAHDYLLKFIEEEQIDAGVTDMERYFLALTPNHFKKMAKDTALFDKHGVKTGWEVVSEAELRENTGLDRYHGAVRMMHKSLHPGLYHLGLLDRVRQAGAQIVAGTRVTKISRQTDGTFHLSTSRGEVRAKNVISATNGYASTATGWVRRRVVSVKSFQAATEPLPPELLKRLFPRRFLFVDSKINLNWLRLTPDGTRVIIGGRTGMNEGDQRIKAARLHADMTKILPDLAAVKISHCWEGQMGFTFDRLPHIGIHDGMHYAAGFNGVGVTMGSWLGSKLGAKLTGAPDAATPFDGRGFSTRPLYTGDPWIVPFMIGWFNTRDRWDLLVG